MLSRAYPELHATVLDLPPVIRIASGLIEQQGASGRVSTLPGDYHATPFPVDNDSVLFFGMMHQESPERILSLLRRAYDAMAPGASVYVSTSAIAPNKSAPRNARSRRGSVTFRKPRPQDSRLVNMYSVFDGLH
jgi:hypothetical protein